MNKRRIVAAALVMMTAVMTMTSCQSLWKKQSLFEAHFVNESRNLKDFEEIEINGSPTVYYTQSDSFSIKVKGPEELVDNIVTTLDDKTLIIRNKGKLGIINVQFGDDEELAVYVTSPDLTSIRLNGSGDFISNERIDTDDMQVVLRGSGDIKVNDMICDRCQIELVGSGDIELDHLDAVKVSAVLIGSGDVDLGLQNVDETSLSLKGSGDMSASFGDNCGFVDCELRGSGDISLKGTVRKFSQRTNGSGSVDVDKLSIQQ